MSFKIDSHGIPGSFEHFHILSSFFVLFDHEDYPTHMLYSLLEIFRRITPQI